MNPADRPTDSGPGAGPREAPAWLVLVLAGLLAGAGVLCDRNAVPGGLLVFGSAAVLVLLCGFVPAVRMSLERPEPTGPRLPGLESTAILAGLGLAIAGLTMVGIHFSSRSAGVRLDWILPVAGVSSLGAGVAVLAWVRHRLGWRALAGGELFPTWFRRPLLPPAARIGSMGVIAAVALWWHLPRGASPWFWLLPGVPIALGLTLGVLGRGSRQPPPPPTAA